MLTGYAKIWQDGIEHIKDYTEPVKDTQTGHFFFDPYRIALQHRYNEKDRTSGIGVLTFAPNGFIWLQTNIYCFEFDKFASYYYSIEQVLEEVNKSKAKNIIIFINDKDFVQAVNHKKPYESEAHNKIHEHIIGKLKTYESYQILFRNKYSDDVKKRLRKESQDASEAPEFNHMGRWQNQPSQIYFNVKTPTEADQKDFAEGLARIFLDFFESYMKEYREEIGEEKFKKFVADANSGKIKKLPDTKRIKANKHKLVKVKNYPKLDKKVLCQNCQTEMTIEECVLEYPEKQLKYINRCGKCRATKILNEKERVIAYGKYPNPKHVYKEEANK